VAVNHRVAGSIPAPGALLLTASLLTTVPPLGLRPSASAPLPLGEGELESSAKTLAGGSSQFKKKGVKIFIIAAPKGAGKTTFARFFLKNYPDITHYLNADVLATGIVPLQPELVAVEAGRIFLQQMRSLTRQRVSFAFETTLSSQNYIRHIAEWQGLWSNPLKLEYIPGAKRSYDHGETEALRSGLQIGNRGRDARWQECRADCAA